MAGREPAKQSLMRFEANKMRAEMYCCVVLMLLLVNCVASLGHQSHDGEQRACIPTARRSNATASLSKN